MNNISDLILKCDIVEPDWERLETKTMVAVTTGRIIRVARRPSIMPFCGLLLTLALWVASASGVLDNVHTTYRIESKEPTLSAAEERIIKEFPELKKLFTKPHYKRIDIEEFIKENYSERRVF